MARPCGSCFSALAFGTQAVMRRREAQVQPDQGWRLFERSEFSQTPVAPSIAVCPRSGPTNPARLFFGDFLLAKQKKVTAQSGAHPDMPRVASANPNTFELEKLTQKVD
jgi:hypothetical protein